jgi:hypothetical protein
MCFGTRQEGSACQREKRSKGQVVFELPIFKKCLVYADSLFGGKCILREPAPLPHIIEFPPTPLPFQVPSADELTVTNNNCRCILSLGVISQECILLESTLSVHCDANKCMKRGHEGISKEENNDYVVFKCKIRGSAGKYRVVVRGGRYPHPFLQQASGQILKDDVTVFTPPRIFASWERASRKGIIVHIEYQSFCPFVRIGSFYSLPRKRMCLTPLRSRLEPLSLPE